MHAGFQWGNLKERNTWEDLRIDGRILKCTSIRWGRGRTFNGSGGGGLALAQDRNRWRTVVNAVTNLRVSYTEYNFSAS
jgi:hypothetical protein